MNHLLPKLHPIDLDGYSLDVDYYLKHDYIDVQEATQELPAIIEWVNVQRQVLLEQKVTKKQELKEVEARAYFDLRGGLFEERGFGKMTEVALEHAVALDENVKKEHRDFAVLVGWLSRLSTLLDALQCKLDLTRTSEATRRKLVEDTPERTRSRDEE